MWYLLLFTSVSVKEFASILVNNNNNNDNENDKDNNKNIDNNNSNNNSNTKLEKYQLLKEEIRKLWTMNKVTVIPVVNGALGVVSRWFVNRSERKIGGNSENSFIRNSTYH